MSSLNTLLEAARFLELQEQSRETVAETLVTMKPARVPTPPALEPKAAPPAPTLAPQTIVISSSNSVGRPAVIHQGQITFATHSPPQFLKKMEQDGQVSSTTALPLPRRVLHNSFDIRNPSTAADEPGRKQPPMVFRAGTREVHNKLEKHRRAHLKECFDTLKRQLPAAQDEKKTSNLSILHSALRYIQTLKRKEREFEHEMERLARDKIASQQRLAGLKKDIAARHDDVDFSKLLPEAAPAAAPEAAPTAPDYQQMEKVAIPILAKNSQVQTTLVPVPYSVPHPGGLVLQKVLVPKGLDGLAPLVSTHFIAAPGKVVPLAQYLMKPVVVVSTASARPS